MMILEDLQQRFREMQGQAGVRAVFGDVIEIEGRKVIPVAAVAYGFGYGGGQAPKSGENGATRGGGGGGVRIEPPALVELAGRALSPPGIGGVARPSAPPRPIHSPPDRESGRRRIATGRAGWHHHLRKQV